MPTTNIYIYISLIDSPLPILTLTDISMYFLFFKCILHILYVLPMSTLDQYVLLESKMY